ncbi:MAG: Phosphate acyltransferase [Chlamydiia bacterium]|nr:Phosphate acyltransferase [Chlamydiia bacterium]
MSERVARIGIELMGGDRSPAEIYKELIEELSSYPQPIHLVFFGNSDVLEGLPRNCNQVVISFYPTSDIITMDDDPVKVIREKPNSSLSVAIKMLREGEIDALVSNGNTGALIAVAKTYLKMMDQILRPCLLALVPTRQHPVAVLDVGANTTCRSEHLYQFAMLGLAYQKTLGMLYPKVAILNIGSEKHKGRIEHRKLYEKMSEFGMQERWDYPIFAGNQESPDLFEARADVYVTDGFSGNMFLKTLEAVSQFVFRGLPAANPESEPQVIESLIRFNQAIQADYPGAIVLGLDKVVLKCHGAADVKHILRSIREAHHLVKENYIGQVAHYLNKSL